MSEKRSFLRAASVVAVVTTLSRVLGLIRDSVIAALMGASRLSDAFQIAFELPNLARRVLGEGSLSAFIVPLFSAERREKGEAGGWRYACNALTAVALVSAGVAVLGCVFARPLFLLCGGFGMLARGETEAALLGARLTRIMFPYLTLLAVSALLMGLCHTVRRFAAPAFGSVLMNVSMIGAGAVFWALHRRGLAASASDPGAAAALQTRFAYWLAISVLIGIALRVAVHFPPLAAEGFRYRPALDLRQRRLWELFGKMPMAVAGMAAAQLMFTINVFFATYMGPGVATHLRYSGRLTQLPTAILAAAMATAILPQLAQFLQEERREDLRHLFGFALRLLAILFPPATVGLIALNRPIVAVLFERGAWSPEATAGTSWALLFYSLGMLPEAGLRLALPLYYARLDLRTPVVTGILAVGLNVVLNLAFFFFTPMRQGGLALATTLSMTANLGYLLYRMRGDVGGAFDRRLVETCWKCAAAAAAMGLFLWAGRAAFEALAPGPTFAGRAAFIGVAVPLGAAVYVGVAAALRTPDLRRAIEVIRGRAGPGRV